MSSGNSIGWQALPSETFAEKAVVRDQQFTTRLPERQVPALIIGKDMASTGNDRQGLNRVSVREIARLIEGYASGTANDSTHSYLSNLSQVQKADGICIDAYDSSNVTEAKIVKEMRASRSLQRLSSLISPGQRIAGSDEGVDIGVSTCLKEIMDVLSNDHEALESLSKLASESLRRAQYRTLRQLAAMLEPLVLAQYSSNHRDDHLNRTLLDAYGMAMSSYVVSCDWEIIWKKRKLLLFASRHLVHSQERNSGSTRPDLMVLRAAACKDLRVTHSAQSAEKEIKYAKQRFERFRMLHQDTIELGIRPDKRWAANLVSGLMRNATSATFNGDVRAVASSLELPQLLDTRQAFLKDLFDLCKNEKGQEVVVFTILEAEVHVASALMNDTQPKDTKLIARLTEHMRAIIGSADRLAENFSSLNTHGKQSASQRHKTFWLQSARASVMKASHVMIQLHLCSIDYDSAFQTLDEMMERILQSVKETSPIRQAVSTILHREQRNKRLARSSMINILLCISRDDMSQQHVRKQVFRMIDVLGKSLKMGMWDVAQEDTDSVRSLSYSSNGSPALDLAKACVRLMGAMSPAQSRTHVPRTGAKYRSSAENASEWQSDYLAMLEQIVILRACAIERCEQDSYDTALGGVVKQPWRTVFKNRIDEEPLRIARIIWSLTSAWQPSTERIRAQARATDPRLSEIAEQLSDTFCRNLLWLVDHILIGFGLAPRTWKVTYDTLLRHLRHLPTPAGRKQATKIFEDGMRRAGLPVPDSHANAHSHL